MLGSSTAGHTLGAIPSAICWLFRSINEQRQKTGARFSVRVSCLELTDQQQIRDLLEAHASDSDQSPSTYLKDDPLFGTLQLQQHNELRAPTAERAAFYLDVATAARQREDNFTHMLYTLHVYQYSVAGKSGVAGGRSRLHLIDIGSSDRRKSSGSVPLSGLGNILLAIFNGQKHVPYKELKLTQLLKECLGSLTCHTTMIAHVSPEAQHYNETLTICQLASRIHRMRRRKIRFVNGSTQNNGSGGSSDEETTKQTSECDPSSSDLSADTVIYVGPSADDATDGEHPPVYIPSLNSGDNRCAMGKVLRGSAAEKSSRIPEERSPMHKSNKGVKSLIQASSKQTSPAHSVTLKPSPGRKLPSKIISSKLLDSLNTKLSITTATATDEQWIDGPRISKSKVAEARHIFKDPIHKKETWIDGPMQLSSVLDQSRMHHETTSSYGFMDNHKKSMIRKWIENQSSQVQRNRLGTASSSLRHFNDNKPAANLEQLKEFSNLRFINGAGDDDLKSASTAESDNLKLNDTEDMTEKFGIKLNLLKVKSNTDTELDLTGSSLINSLERLNRRLDMLEDDDEEEEIVVPPPLPLIEPLSNGVSREVSMESLNLSHKDVISFRPSRHSLSSEDEILEIIETDDEDPVLMQDSCLQVTEEDIALCMANKSMSENRQDQHPLKILSQENLTVVSTFSDSLSILSETECHRSYLTSSVGMGMLRTHFDQDDYLEQENRNKFDQLARLHELYQSKLALANVTNSLTYQREKSVTASIPEPLSSSTSEELHSQSRLQSLSLSDVYYNDTTSNHGSIYSESKRVEDNQEERKICDSCRQNLKMTTSFWYPRSISHRSSPRRYCGRFVECNISSLRHPDGASNPNLKEDIERIPGNGASGSEPEEEYIEAKETFFSTATTTMDTFLQRTHERTVAGKSHIEDEIQFPTAVLSSALLPGKVQRKTCNVDSTVRLNKDGYDSGADSNSRTPKFSPATLSRYRAESSGYDSVVKDSETSSISSDSSRKTSALHEQNSGAMGVLTSTLCGCFSGGTTTRIRTQGSGSINSRENNRDQHRRRIEGSQIRSSTCNRSRQNLQGGQPSSAPASS